METSEIQKKKVFFEKGFLFQLSYSVPVETWLFGVLKSNFLLREEMKTYTNVRPMGFAKDPNL